MIGIVPAAGRGTRLGPVGRRLPKCLLRVGGEILLDRAVGHLCRAGCDAVYVVAGHRGDRVERHLKRRFGNPVAVVRQPAPGGLPQALAAVARTWGRQDAMIYCPDNYFSDYYDVEALRETFARHRPEVLICCTRTVVRPDRVALEGPFDDYGRTEVPVTALVGQRTGEAWVPTGLWAQCGAVAGLTLNGPGTQGRGEARIGDLWRHVMAGGGRVWGRRLLGERLDITTLADQAAANRHIARRQAAGRCGVAVVLTTPDGRYLLQRRDDKPEIRYPGYWGLFGGTGQPGETPEDAARRELHEELGLVVDRLSPVRRFVENLKCEHVFAAAVDGNWPHLKLREGRRFGAFTPAALVTLKIRNDDRESLQQVLGRP